MTFSEKELLWACKAYLLEQYINSKILKESAVESKKFIQFIKNIDIKTAESLLEKDRYVGSINVTRYMNSPEDLIKLQRKDAPLASRIKIAIDIQRREEILKDTLLKKYGIRMAIGALAAALAVVGYMLYKRYTDVCRKRCDTVKDKAKCIRDCRIAGARQSIIHLKTEKTKCGSDPKCQKKFDTQISKWEDKMKQLLK